jgi:hypothetical protein
MGFLDIATVLGMVQEGWEGFLVDRGNTDYSPRYDHGSGVAAMVIGNQVGIFPPCTLVVVTSESPNRKVEKWYDFPNEKIIAQLIDTLDDVKKKKGRASRPST